MLATPPQQDRSRKSLERILAAATTVLLRGNSEFTMFNVAAEGGLTIGGIYARFKSKEELLQALKERMVRTLIHGIEAELGGLHATSIEACLDIFTSHLMRFVDESGTLLCRLLAAEPANRPPSKEDSMGLARIRETYCGAIARVPGYENATLQPAISVSFELMICPWFQRIKVSSFHDELSWADFLGQLEQAARAYLYSVGR